MAEGLKRSPSPSPEEPDTKKTKTDPEPHNTDFVLFKEITGHTAPVSVVKYSPDGKWIASASSDKTVRIWEAETGNPHAVLSGHSLGISDVAWSPDSKYVASASDDKNIFIWDSQTGERLKVLSGHTNYVFSLKFNRASNLLVSGSYDESVKLWDFVNGTCTRTFPAHSDPVSSVDFANDGTIIASGSFDGVIRLWNTDNGACLKTLTSDENHPVYGPIVWLCSYSFSSFVTFSSNSRYILASTLDDRMHLWSLGNSDTKPKKLKVYSGHVNKKYCIFAAFWESKYLISGSEDNKFYIWEVNTSKLIRSVEAHSGPVIGVSVHPHNKSRIVTCSMDNTIKIWDNSISKPQDL